MSISSPEKRLLFWRGLLFVASWGAYAGLYLTRKNYSVAQLGFTEEFGWSKEQIGVIATAYLIVYATGQFLNGILADRVGPRRMLATAFVLSGSMSLALGYADAIGIMALLYGINGYAQSIGWPSVTKIMASWTPIEQRGRVMGWWGTNYPVGDAAATALATLLMATWGWRYAFWVPGLFAFVLAGVMLAVIRNHPRDVGLEPVVPDPITEVHSEDEDEPGAEAGTFRAWLETVGQSRIIRLGAAYFCLKFVRYAIIFWLGFLLMERLGFSKEEAGYLMVPFPLAGMVGSIASGFISDRFFQARRAPVAAIMEVGLVIALLCFIVVPADYVAVVIVLSVVGFMLYGADMLIVGTAAMDFGSQRVAARITGFVNGMGSIGAAVQGLLIGFLSEAYGWTAVTLLMASLIVVCIVITASLWRETA